MRVMCKPGSVGDLGGQPPRSTRPKETDPKETDPKETVCGEPVCLDCSTYQNNYKCPARLRSNLGLGSPGRGHLVDSRG